MTPHKDNFGPHTGILKVEEKIEIPAKKNVELSEVHPWLRSNFHHSRGDDKNGIFECFFPNQFLAVM
jgi:hypothetical protein